MRRSGYTLVEVLLAMTIAVVLLGALYVAVDLQLRSAQAGRDIVEQSTIARAAFSRFDSDAACVVSLPDAARFRRYASTFSSSSSSGSSGSGASGSGASGSGASGSGSSGSSSGSSSTTTTITSMSATGNVSTFTNTGTVQVIVAPYGVIGDSQTLNMFVNRVPRELINAQLQQQEGSDIPIAGDVRRVSYWLADGGGLAKQEVKVLTADDSGVIDQSSLPPSNVDNMKMFVEEVKSVQFEYFDGTNWNDSWDSTQAGADGVTPIGSPVAIRVTLGIAQAGKPDKSYQHVITFPTANGTTAMQTTTPSTTGGGTTSP